MEQQNSDMRAQCAFETLINRIQLNMTTEISAQTISGRRLREDTRVRAKEKCIH